MRNHSQLTRRYQNLEIIRLRDKFLNNDEDEEPTDATQLRLNLMATCAKLSESVQELTMRDCQILKNDFMNILRAFIHVRVLTLTSIILSDDVPTARDSDDFNISFPNLTSLRLSNCDFFCLLLFKSHNKLKTFELKGPSQSDVKELENFLLKQSSLKTLTLKNFRFNSSFSSNRLGFVQFQLKSLNLTNIKWDIANHFEMFVKSQTSLQDLTLKAVHQWLPPHAENSQLFTSVLRHFLTNNLRLSTFSFDSMFHQNVKNIDFLPGIINPNITQLSFVNRDANSNMFEACSKAFPNVETLKFEDHFSSDASSLLQYLQRFSELQSLDLAVAPKSLASLKLGSDNLLKFKYCATNEGKSSTLVGEFLASNPKITNLRLNIEPLTFKEISEIIICLSPTLERFTLSDLHLNQTEVEIIVRNFPRLRQICSDFQLNPEILATLAFNNIQYATQYDNDASLYERD